MIKTRIRHKKPLRNPITIRLSDAQAARYNDCGRVKYVRALIDADIDKESRKRIKKIT